MADETTPQERLEPRPERQKTVTVQRLWRHERDGYFLISANGEQRLIPANDLPENNVLPAATFNQLEIPRWVNSRLPEEE